PRPLVNNPLSSEPLTPVIHPTSLTNLTNNFSSQQWQFLTTQLQTDSLNEITSKYNELPIAINPISSSISTAPYNSTSFLFLLLLIIQHLLLFLLLLMI
ncbi:3723_t:CDS:2, partial [Gigaspora margarita]